MEFGSNLIGAILGALELPKQFASSFGAVALEFQSNFRAVLAEFPWSSRAISVPFRCNFSLF